MFVAKGEGEGERTLQHEHNTDIATAGSCAGAVVDETTASFDESIGITARDDEHDSASKLSSVDSHTPSSSSIAASRCTTAAKMMATEKTETATFAVSVTETTTSASTIPKITITKFPVLLYAPDPSS